MKVIYSHCKNFGKLLYRRESTNKPYLSTDCKPFVYVYLFFYFSDCIFITFFYKIGFYWIYTFVSVFGSSVFCQVLR